MPTTCANASTIGCVSKRILAGKRPNDARTTSTGSPLATSHAPDRSQPCAVRRHSSGREKSTCSSIAATSTQSASAAATGPYAACFFAIIRTRIVALLAQKSHAADRPHRDHSSDGTDSSRQARCRVTTPMPTRDRNPRLGRKMRRANAIDLETARCHLSTQPPAARC